MLAVTIPIFGTFLVLFKRRVASHLIFFCPPSTVFLSVFLSNSTISRDRFFREQSKLIKNYDSKKSILIMENEHLFGFLNLRGFLVSILNLIFHPIFSGALKRMTLCSRFCTEQKMALEMTELKEAFCCEKTPKFELFLRGKNKLFLTIIYSSKWSIKKCF